MYAGLCNPELAPGDNSMKKTHREGVTNVSIHYVDCAIRVTCVTDAHVSSVGGDDHVV